MKEYVRAAQKTYKSLRELEISAEDSKRIVKCCYTCLDRAFGTPELIDGYIKLISKAEVKSDEALSMLEKRLFGMWC